MAATDSKSVSFFPREHGATAMLLSPFVCAVILARRFSLESIALEAAALIATVFAFAVKDPLVAVFRQRFVWKQPHPETAVAWRWLAVEIPVLLACGAALLVHGPRREYALLGLCEGAFGALAVWMNVSNQQRSEWFQVISAVALAATSLAACLAALGGIPLWGWVLWALCCLQASAAIFVVHARLDARVATHRTLSQPGSRRAAKIAIAGMAAAATAAVILDFRWIISAALLLAASGYTWELRRQTDSASLKMPLRRVGLQALALSSVYGALLIIGLW
jgi:hypothetical protein